ncbi:MAG: CarD family transcriptional regulator [Clostridia bacterium]|nr:CarD family transcriptional regulator [Clostridia bacterium]
MFNIGELLFYGTNGVCRISEICSSPFDASDTRRFYKLTPIAENSTLVIYTPVDNTQVVMRSLISKEEAEALVARIPEIEKVTVAVEKHRKDAYRETIREGNPEGYVKIIKTVRARREYFRRTRRRVPDLDNDFEHTARVCLYGELSTVLGVSRDEISRIVLEGISEDT